MVKMWVTKYALTSGITEYDNASIEGECFVVKRASGQDLVFHRKHCFLFREDAVEHAESLRERKINALLRQIERMKELDFDK